MRRATFMLSVLLLTVSTPSLAQDLVRFITERADLTPDQLEQVLVLEGLPTTDRVDVVEIDPEVLARADLMGISVAVSPNLALQFPQADLRSLGNDSLVWSAVTAAGIHPGTVMSATFTITEGEVAGTIFTPDETYRFQPLPGDLSAIVTSDAFPPEHPEGALEPAGDQPVPSAADLRAEGDEALATVSVLVLATTEAAADIGNLASLADLAVAVSNTSFTNSAIPLEFTVAGVQVVEYEESGSHQQDVDNLAGKTDGFIDDIHALRDELKADVVVLLTADDSYCGMADRIYAGASSAFATVYWPCAVDNLSFPHEVGHLLGACHNPEVPGGCPFTYGYGFINPEKKVRDVMAYDCTGGCRRMPQWAQPVDWGDEDIRHNARVLRETSTRASNFRP